VLHARLPSAPWMVPAQRRLPGVQPLDMSDWLIVDEAYGGQMALRDRLIAEKSRRGAGPHRGLRGRRGRGAGDGAGASARGVHARRPPDHAARRRLCGPFWRHAARWWPGGWCRRTSASSRRPEGRLRTPSLRRDPVLSGQLDPCGEDRPPARRDPSGRAGLRSDGMAARVQRMFDAIRPGAAALAAERAALRQPPTCTSPGPRPPRARRGLDTPYLRSERQCLLRLPRTGRSCSRSTPTCCP
jgi:hypothetical protein